MKQIIFFAFIVFIIFYNFEFFNSDHLKLLSKNELENILINNSDNYYDTFTELDLKVRDVKSIDEYKNKIKNIHYKSNNNEYNNILYIINKIDNIFKQYNIIGFDGNKASKIKWNIGIINSNIYEHGLPHTRNDVIIISNNILNNNKLEITLFHEKIHIYQKLYPNDIKNYFINNGFYISKKNTNLIRANPDTDNYIYKNKNNQEMMCVYNNNPTSILDVSYIPNNDIKNEHPLEYMAYMIQSEFYNL